MDTIYSRNRIKLPKIILNNKNNKKMIKFIIILIIAILTFIRIVSSISPIFETLCKEKARSIATGICNEESTKIIQNYRYEDLVTISKDKDDNITMIKSNIAPINLIISDVAQNIQTKINEKTQDKIGIRLGAFLGIRMLSGVGPMLPIKISVVGNVDTNLISEFNESGINQTIHRIYLQVDCEINIVTQYKQTNERISNQILIAENVIVGKIPETYYNLEGMNNEDVLNVLE